jgi:hypothetical protein
MKVESLSNEIFIECFQYLLQIKWKWLVLIKLQQFQSHFWHKDHHWYTNYEINKFWLSIYTMLYIRNAYRLISPMNRYINSLTSYSNGFNNVKDLTLCIRTIKNDSSYYFRNAQS